MCGIIASIRKGENVKTHKRVLKCFENQKGRGTDGFGIVFLKNKKIAELFRATKESETIKKIKDTENVDAIFLHHRFPTSTPNIKESTHPIKCSDKSFKYKYFIMHNGIIKNTDERRDEHNKTGYKYTTELKKYYETPKGKRYHYPVEWNDSESLAWDIAEFCEGKTSEIRSEGSIAFIGLQVEKGTDKIVNILYGRNSQ